MTDTTRKATVAPDDRPDAPRVYNRSSLTYSNTFDSPVKRNIIRLIELLTGKIRIARLVRRFERMGSFKGQAFWRATLDVMGIDLLPTNWPAFPRPDRWFSWPIIRMVWLMV